MPSMVNGVGTRYRNEKGHRHRPGKCQRCGKSGNLASYDTEKWFVVFLIPVFRVEKLHIINYCAHCTSHGAIPMAEWESRRTESVGATLAKYRENPKDGQAAVALLEAADFFEDEQTYASSFKEIKEALQDDPDVLTYLARMSLRKGETTEAERLYARVVEIDPFNFNAHTLLMLIAVDAKDVARAEKHAGVITENGAANFAHNLIQLVQLYQEKGQHEQALTMLDRIESLSPEIAQEKDFARLRELSATYQATGKPLKKTGFEFGRAERERKRRNSLIAGIVVVAGVLCLYIAYCALVGRREQLWLVNAADTPYSVKIDGKEVRLEAGSDTPLRVGLGKHTIEPLGDWPTFPPTEFAMEKGLLTRPFSETVFVSNPDRLGVLVQVTVYYSSRREHTPEPSIGVRRGDLFVEIPNIQHPFEEPPKSISTSSGSGTVHRTLLQSGGLETLLRIGPEKMDRSARLDLARERMKRDPDGELGLLSIAMPPDDTAELLRDKFPAGFASQAERNCYLGAMAAAGKLQDAVAALDAALAKEPASAPLLSARAVIEADPDKSLELHKRAAESTDATDEIKGEYASALFRRGRTEEALLVVKSLKGLVESCSSEYYRALIQREEFETLQSEIASHEPGFRGDLDGLLEASLSDAGKGKVDLEKLPKSEHHKLVVGPYIAANLLYAEGKVREAAAEFSRGYWGRCDGAILSGNLEDAEDFRNYSLGGAGDDDLLLYLAARNRRDGMLVSRERPLAARYLRTALHGGPVLADMIEGKQPVIPEKALAVDLGPRTKAMALLMLAQEKPELRTALLPEVERLNSGRAYPAGLIRQYMQNGQ